MSSDQKNLIMASRGTLITPDKYNMKYIMYSPTTTSKCIIFGIHGGCFQDGDETGTLNKKNLLNMVQ